MLVVGAVGAGKSTFSAELAEATAQTIIRQAASRRAPAQQRSPASTGERYLTGASSGGVAHRLVLGRGGAIGRRVG